jgi:hypothetical protein
MEYREIRERRRLKAMLNRALKDYGFYNVIWKRICNDVLKLCNEVIQDTGFKGREEYPYHSLYEGNNRVVSEVIVYLAGILQEIIPEFYIEHGQMINRNKKLVKFRMVNNGEKKTWEITEESGEDVEVRYLPKYGYLFKNENGHLGIAYKCEEERKAVSCRIVQEDEENIKLVAGDNEFNVKCLKYWNFETDPFDEMD